MGIPLQPVNIPGWAAEYQRADPFLKAMDIAKSLQGMRAQSRALALKQQQMAQQRALEQQRLHQQAPLTQAHTQYYQELLKGMPAQAALRTAQAQEAAQKAEYAKHHPGSVYGGKAGQMMDMLQQLQNQSGASAQPSSTQAPLMQSPPPSPIAQAPDSTMASLISQAITPTQPSVPSEPRASSTLLGAAPTSAPPSQPVETPPGNIPATSSNIPHDSPGHISPSWVGADIATKKVQDFLNRAQPPTAASLGFHFDSPQKQKMADAIVQQTFPSNWQSYRANRLSLDMYQQLPSPFKTQQVALLSNFMPADLANKYFAAGGDLKELSDQLGIPENQMRQLTGQFAPTTAMLSQAQRQGWATAIYNSVSPIASKWIAPYIQNVAGLSPTMIADQLFRQGKNGAFKKGDQDKIAKALAGSAMQMELVGARIQGGGLRTNKQLITMAYKNANSNLRNFQSLLKPETYRKSQAYLGQLLNQAHEATNQYISNPSRRMSNLPGVALTGDLGSTPATQAAATHKMPSFKTKEEAQKWAKSLSHEDANRYFGGTS